MISVPLPPCMIVLNSTSHPGAFFFSFPRHPFLSFLPPFLFCSRFAFPFTGCSAHFTCRVMWRVFQVVIFFPSSFSLFSFDLSFLPTAATRPCLLALCAPVCQQRHTILQPDVLSFPDPFQSTRMQCSVILLEFRYCIHVVSAQRRQAAQLLGTLISRCFYLSNCACACSVQELA